MDEALTEEIEKEIMNESKVLTKEIDSELQHIKFLFDNNDRETAYYRNELNRLKCRLCSTYDENDRNDYYKEYRIALAGLLAVMHKNQELVNESSRFLEDLQNFSNTSGLICDSEQHELSIILNEHAS